MSKARNFLNQFDEKDELSGIEIFDRPELRYFASNVYVLRHKKTNKFYNAKSFFGLRKPNPSNLSDTKAFPWSGMELADISWDFETIYDRVEVK